MIDFKKELENFKPCMNMDEVEEAVYGSDLKDFTDAMREVIEEFRENESEIIQEKNIFSKKIKEEIREELQKEQEKLARQAAEAIEADKNKSAEEHIEEGIDGETEEKEEQGEKGEGE